MSLLARVYWRIADSISTWRFRHLSGVDAPRSVRCFGMPIVSVVPGARIVVGERVVLVSRSTSTALGVAHPVVLRAMLPGASLAIGEDTGISGGSFCAATRVTIGARCLFGADVLVADTDFHPVDQVPRRYEPLEAAGSKSIDIGDDVFIGARATILKGVSVGAGSVIGAASVATASLPARAVHAGSPANTVRPLRGAL